MTKFLKKWFQTRPIDIGDHSHALPGSNVPQPERGVLVASHGSSGDRGQELSVGRLGGDADGRVTRENGEVPA